MLKGVKTIKEVLSGPLGEVKIRGWVQTIRHLGSISFLIIRDRGGTVQVTVDVSDKKTFKQIKELKRESVVVVKGELIKNPTAPSGKEIVTPVIRVLSEPIDSLPLPIFTPAYEKVKQSLRLDYRWLDLRLPTHRLIFEVWTEMERTLVDYLVEQGFIRIHTPNLMKSASESGAELFQVDYFGKTAYLAQSAQFYKQMAMAAGFERVFSVGPVFRANKSFTRRHDTEFTQYDIEVSFIQSHLDVMSIEEDMIVVMLQAIKKKYGSVVKEVFGQEVVVPQKPFPRLTLQQAKEQVKKMEVEGTKEDDLSPEEERKVGEYIKAKYDHDFVFITDYPVSARPFYHMRYETQPYLTKSFDLLYKGLEITTGAQREHRYKVLKNQAIESGLKMSSIQYYLNFFKYGCPPHGGLGFGPSRFLMQLLGLPDVREVTYLYRGVNRLSP